MLIEYKEWIITAYNLLLWPLVIGGFVLGKDANTRWFLLGFAVIAGLSAASSVVVMQFSLPGYWFHIFELFLIYVFIQFVLYRPIISVYLGSVLQRIPIAWLASFIAMLLPAKYQWRLQPAELALRRLFMAFAVVHLMTLLHYVLFYSGVAAPDGVLEQLGFDRRLVWAASYATYLVFLVVELLLLVAVILGGLHARWRLKA